MKAKVLKVVAIESHSTVREVMAALREVLKAEGKAANEWTVVVVEPQHTEEDKPNGIVTGMSFSPPSAGNDGGASARIGYLRGDGR